MPPLYQRGEKHGAAAGKKLPPQLPCLLECAGAKRPYVEALTFERPRRILHCLASLRRTRDETIVFKETDGNTFQIFQRLIPEADWRAHRIQSVLPGERDEEQREVADSTRHRPDRAKNGKGPIACEQMTACGNAARRRFERAYSGKVSRFAHRASAVAAQSARGKAGGNCRRFAAARSARA